MPDTDCPLCGGIVRGGGTAGFFVVTEESLAQAMFRVTVELPGLLSDVDMLNDPAEGDPLPAARAILAAHHETVG